MLPEPVAADCANGIGTTVGTLFDEQGAVGASSPFCGADAPARPDLGAKTHDTPAILRKV
jgi:hypothetical protein